MPRFRCAAATLGAGQRTGHLELGIAAAVELTGWREHFTRWLRACYDDPDRYLETLPDRYAAGLPDRLDPPEILEHNGVKGRDRYGVDCADRRAWTWEVRIARRLSFARVRALHVPFDMLSKALPLARRMAFASNSGVIPEVKALLPDQSANHDTLYQDSGRVLRELIG